MMFDNMTDDSLEVLREENQAHAYQLAHGHLNDMAGRLGSMEDVRRYIFGGNATVTIKSNATSNRLTLRFKQPLDRSCTWVSLLNGSDNESNYAFIGTIRDTANGLALRQSAKSKVSMSAPSARLVCWLLKALNLGGDVLTQCEVWHEGKCGRCGRKLTVPSSIASGFGPECITKQ